MTQPQSVMHSTTVPLRWTDFDRFGHLNNAQYIEIAQEARLEFAQQEFVGRGLEIPAVFVRHLDVDYLRPILPDTVVATVETSVVEIGRTSFTTRQEVKDRQGRVGCVVECVQVAVDIDTSRPRAITAQELKVLERRADEDTEEDSDDATKDDE
ncbi:acyl-CoA thioesterase [Corynebacterium poyangense]|uniref:Acyl-CoA thioesterase n=1 Tax=Corynebacterium poyangense TaxID=2684405 RepID=A0A7H0SQN3_9CORY|nr:thioesterase family protein [Corynebacterium poyangense]MBZ8178247.1 acyl-CoA thioesterase [Corynebacterium poyangense]QNQ90858.1 acyl-CoA thioesterase [Corynebacterium poyangense]